MVNGKINVCFTAAAPSVPVPLYIRPTPDELAVEAEEWADISAAQEGHRQQRLWARESARIERQRGGRTGSFPLPTWKG